MTKTMTNFAFEPRTYKVSFIKNRVNRVGKKDKKTVVNELKASTFAEAVNIARDLLWKIRDMLPKKYGGGFLEFLDEHGNCHWSGKITIGDHGGYHTINEGVNDNFDWTDALKMEGVVTPYTSKRKPQETKDSNVQLHIVIERIPTDGTSTNFDEVMAHI